VINRIVDAALGNRMLVLMLIAALVAAGLMSMQRLPFDADPDISPLNSINYFEEVAHFMRHRGDDRQDARERVNDFFRLFMVPGMQHCSGGPGPNTFDMLTALEEWVEKGKAPNRIIASHLTGGVVDRTRPLCVYPRVAVFTGTGSTNDAANFKCRMPREERRHGRHHDDDDDDDDD